MRESEAQLWIVALTYASAVPRDPICPAVCSKAAAGCLRQNVRRGAGSIAASILFAVLLFVASVSSGRTQNPAQPDSKKHQAIAITSGAQAVLRDDGRVVAFKNTAKGGAAVLIEGLTDIVDVSGGVSGMPNTLPAESAAFWIALRRDGDVYQWNGVCSEEGYIDCRYSRAVKVAVLSNISAISSDQGTHLALDRKGQVWGWGWDNNGLLTGASYPAVTPKLAIVQTPIRILVPTDLRSIAVGVPHAVGIDRKGGVWIWGRNDRPDAQPEASQSFLVGQMTFRKVDGLPPASSAAALARTYVVTENGEIWSWGIASYNRHEAFGLRRPQKMEGVCPAKAVSVATGIAVAVCSDGSVYRDLWPGVKATSELVSEEKWERVPYLSEINLLHVDDTIFDLALVNRSGDAYRDSFEESGTVIKPLTKLEGPLGLGR